MRHTLLPIPMLLVVAACADSPVAPVTNVELAFAKPAPAPALTFVFPQNGAGVTSDGNGPYVPGVCGVATMLYEGGSGDAVLETRGAPLQPRKCPTGARSLVFAWSDGTEVIEARVNLGALGGTGGILAVPDGATRSMPLNIAIDTSTRCTHMKFRNMKTDGTATIGGQDAVVTRSGNTWTVTASQAECLRPDGSFEAVSLSVAFSVSL